LSSPRQGPLAKAVQILFATANEHKVLEVSRLARHHPVRIIPVPRRIEVEENGINLLANARLKMAAYSAAFPGAAILAEDSGLFVRVLGGAPGVRSARYGGKKGKDQLEYLLSILSGEKDRYAEFRTVFCLRIGSRVVNSLGCTAGTILTNITGHAGFGYDPVFYSIELGKSFGVAEAAEKDRVSHRFRALERLFRKLDL